MADYIKREALEAALNHRLAFLMAENGQYDHYTSGYDEAVDTVENFPTADVVEVVHGKWFWADDGYCRCSECTQKAPLVQPLDDEPEAVMTKYCPNCGAKMDGRGNNADMG